MKKSFTKIFIFFILISILLHSEDLANRYKQMMNTTPIQIKKKVSSKNLKKTNYQLIDEIKKIEALKQDTFEATSEFNNRREAAIVKLKNKVKFFAQNASEEYSAGRATMKSYDADKEKMQLILDWNTDLKTIFPEIKNMKKVSLRIARTAARELFKNQDTHYFHIDITYKNNKLMISKMSMYNKYTMNKPEKKRPNLKKNTASALNSYEKSINSPNIPISHFKQNELSYIKYKVVNVASWDTLNVRKNPYVTKNNKVGELQNNAKDIHIIKCKFNQKGSKWCYIKYYEQYSTLEGWVIARCLAEQNPSYSTKNKYKVVHVRSDDTLSVRNGPGTQYHKIGDLPFNAIGVDLGACQYSNKGGRWCIVTYGNLRGWASEKFLRRQ
jgi:uncharacterized protein YraI